MAWNAQPRAGRGRWDDDQMVQQCAAGLANPQAIHQLSLLAPSQTVGEERGPLGALLGLGGKSSEEPDRCQIGQDSCQALPDAGVGSLPTREQDLICRRGWITKLAHGLGRAFDIGVDGCWRSGRISLDQRAHPSLEQECLGNVAGQERDLSIQRSGGEPPDWSARTAQPVHHLALLDRQRCGECAAELYQDEGHLLGTPLASITLVSNSQHYCAELVRRSQVDTVELPMDRHGIKMNDPGRVDHRKAGRGEPPGKAPEPTESSGLVRSGKEGEAKVGVGGLCCAEER
jgi:hypothetical protein